MQSACIDGELCGVREDGVTSFAMMQAASDAGTAALVYYAFDLLFLDGVSLVDERSSTRKLALAKLLKRASPGVAYSEHLEGEKRLLKAPLARPEGWPERSQASRRSFQSGAASRKQDPGEPQAGRHIAPDRRRRRVEPWSTR